MKSGQRSAHSQLPIVQVTIWSGVSNEDIFGFALSRMISFCAGSDAVKAVYLINEIITNRSI